uniref:Medium-chain acyl-[acyl-carrier-protein] hydrolase n=1 Tax=Candidatus Kentrum eta TaxID=2126337 RepID=A0A450UTP9_9GAMM|nr:MAG: medium-chain acyl-[acyl-carrier-protein] hydrolase [Candidatus Kentron sp. H]VFJ96642.1 MAG: medium-chain acyl-[acyl-carrier-protein] hydrolase [Candidatus Kentron sp. H]VFK02473.1 MAG: medium-chain acyl-[acyl-carrier-protein] hydrolase [Candidatus Kentron sp. H]
MTTNHWIAGTANPQANARLFCLPFAGGGTLTYRKWHQHLPPEIELRPVRLPGREGRFDEACYRKARPLAQALASALAPYLDLPFAFFGHSMGALLSFELARELRRRGTPEPFCLMASGRRAPQLHLSQAPTPLHTLSDPALIDKLRSYGGTPKAVLDHDKLMELFLPAIRADFAIVETYVHAPEAPFDCAIRAFGGEMDTGTERAALDAWREQTTGSFALRLFPGDHFYLNKFDGAPLAQAVAEELESLLAGK